MTDRDDAEFLDGDVLGEEVGDGGLPGTSNFPPDHSWGVEDPTRDDIDDDLATRDRRLDHAAPRRDKAFSLVADGSTQGLADDESQEIASAVDATDDDVAPEEAALHIVADGIGS